MLLNLHLNHSYWIIQSPNKVPVTSSGRWHMDAAHDQRFAQGCRAGEPGRACHHSPELAWCQHGYSTSVATFLVLAASL